MHEQTIRLFWKVWIVWMSSTINIILYTNTNKEKIGSFFSRALAYEVNGFPR